MTQTSSTVTGLADRYLAGWRDHDGDALAAAFADTGTYTDPTLPSPLPKPAIAGYVAVMIAAFPDLHFVGEGVVADGDVAVARWRMQGTNTGVLPGMPQPTGRRCDLPGVDVITAGPEGIESVVGYFDQKTFVEQLGLRALVVPGDEPGLRWGFSARTEVGRTQLPGALSMTMIEVRADEEAELNARTAAVVETVAADPGYLGSLLTNGSGRGHTVTAWSSAEAAERAMSSAGPHREAVARVDDGFGLRGFTSIWVPYRLNAQWARCPGCGARVRFRDGATVATCPCGGEVHAVAHL